MSETTTADAQAKPLDADVFDLEPREPALPALAEETAAVRLPDNAPANLMMLALSRGASIAEVREMMIVQREWSAEEARKSYNDAFARFSAHSIEILKTKHVEFTTQKGVTAYDHAELSGVLDAVKPHLSKYGLSISWKTTKQDKNWIEVTCTLKHSGGHFETVTLGAEPDDSGGKNKIQAIGSAITYLERYTAKAILGVAEKGQDDDGAGTGPRGDARPAQQQQQSQSSKLDEVREVGRKNADFGMVKLLDWWGKLDSKTRNALGKEFGAMRKTAQNVDRAAGRE